MQKRRLSEGKSAQRDNCVATAIYLGSTHLNTGGDESSETKILHLNGQTAQEYCPALQLLGYS